MSDNGWKTETVFVTRKPIRVLSLGAGVQSSALLLAAYEGLIEPIDFSVFADTQSEPDEVYDWLEKLKIFVADKIKIITVSKGNLAEDILSEGRSSSIPVYLKDDSGNKGMLMRQCTYDYKIAMVYKAVREELGYKPRQRVFHDVRMLMGISTDEKGRMKQNKERWIENEYPLITDLYWHRKQCIDYVKKFNLGTPPKSACWMCPYHNDRLWLNMKNNDPKSFNKAVEFEKKLQGLKKYNNEPYLHRSLVPLSQVDFNESQMNFQLNDFEDECEGMCGI